MCCVFTNQTLVFPEKMHWRRSCPSQTHGYRCPEDRRSTAGQHKVFRCLSGICLLLGIETSKKYLWCLLLKNHAQQKCGSCPLLKMKSQKKYFSCLLFLTGTTGANCPLIKLPIVGQNISQVSEKCFANRRNFLALSIVKGIIETENNLGGAVN